MYHGSGSNPNQSDALQSFDTDSRFKIQLISLFLFFFSSDISMTLRTCLVHPRNSVQNWNLWNFPLSHYRWRLNELWYGTVLYGWPGFFLHCAALPASRRVPRWCHTLLDGLRLHRPRVTPRRSLTWSVSENEKKINRDETQRSAIIENNDARSKNAEIWKL
jgi:hypothetical protein